jgi:predicted RNase H-like HicB family nuclease
MSSVGLASDWPPAVESHFDHRNEQYRYGDSSLVERFSFRSNAPSIWLHLRESGGALSQVDRCRRRKIFLCRGRTRYRSCMAASVDFTISFDSPDEKGWIVARVLEVPGAMSQGRTREEARENVLDALRTVLTPDEELAGQTPESDREHLRFTAAA